MKKIFRIVIIENKFSNVNFCILYFQIICHLKNFTIKKWIIISWYQIKEIKRI